MTKKRGKKLVELQTRNLPLDLFDTEGEELDDDWEWEEKVHKVQRTHERYWDDE